MVCILQAVDPRRENDWFVLRIQKPNNSTELCYKINGEDEDEDEDMKRSIY